MKLHDAGSLSQQYLQNYFGSGATSGSSTTGVTSQTSAKQNQASPFALLLTNLQQIEQSNPAKYSQVTSKISGHLQEAAQKAKAQGNTTLANQLATLSNDFSTASQTGQLPNVQDLAANSAGANSIASFLQYMSQGSSSMLSATSISQSLNPIGAANGSSL